MNVIPLEKPIVDLENKIISLRQLSEDSGKSHDREIQKLEKKSLDLKKKLFSNLSAHQISQLARHPQRPRTLEVIKALFTDFIELHGDRNFMDDQAIVGGIAKFANYRVVVIGHQKGGTTNENILRNFGMPKPEGYRKALRLMSMAERFNLPIITFVDTPGAYPGIGAEKRGQAEAIAKNIMVMARLKVPIITFILGEGGSGGALALAVANKIHMLSYSIYSVISPEGCASILMKDATKASEAAESLRITAEDALQFGIIDSIIPEPLGGSHRNPEQLFKGIKDTIHKELLTLNSMSPSELRDHRIQKFLEIGHLANDKKRTRRKPKRS